MKNEDLIDQLVKFLREIDIPVQFGTVDESTILPGLVFRKGILIIDQERLNYPGDLLHEAGHYAVKLPSERENLNDDMDSDPGEEMAAIAWSIAAAVKIGIPPEVVLHDEGYKGGGDYLIEPLLEGNGPGTPLLDWYGMSDGFPNMKRWLREDPDLRDVTDNPIQEH